VFVQLPSICIIRFRNELDFDSDQKMKFEDVKLIYNPTIRVQQIASENAIGCKLLHLVVINMGISCQSE
jgi:hypothetical protein